MPGEHELLLRTEVQKQRGADRAYTDARTAGRLAERLHELLEGGVSIDSAHNTWELAVWKELLNERKARRKSRGTQKWWDAVIKEVTRLMESPKYGSPDLPDLRALRATGTEHGGGAG